MSGCLGLGGIGDRWVNPKGCGAPFSGDEDVLKLNMVMFAHIHVYTKNHGIMHRENCIKYELYLHTVVKKKKAQSDCDC